MTNSSRGIYYLLSVGYGEIRITTYSDNYIEIKSLFDKELRERTEDVDYITIEKIVAAEDFSTEAKVGGDEELLYDLIYITDYVNFRNDDGLRVTKVFIDKWLVTRIKDDINTDEEDMEYPKSTCDFYGYDWNDFTWNDFLVCRMKDGDVRRYYGDTDSEEVNWYGFATKYLQGKFD